MEKVTANAVFRALQKQKTAIVDFIQENGLNDEIWLKVVMNETHKPVITAFIERAGTTMKRWYSEAEKIWPEKLAGMDFSVPTSSARVYLDALENLHLSQRQGSISATTENEVRSIVAQWVQKMKSKEEIVAEIQKLSKVFWKNRADLIAINQIGKAFQYGNFVWMKEYYDAWYVVLKYWSTVNDNRVTRTHTVNQNDGWIFQDKTFSGTDDIMPPASDNPRCRCALIYDIWKKTWEKQPKNIQQKITWSEKRQNFLENFERIKKYYSFKDDVFLQRMLENYEWSLAENLRILMPEWITKEESIAFSRWKSDDYLHINTIFRNGVSSKYDGLALHLVNAINNFPLYRGGVWRGISHEWTIEKLKIMKKGDIFVDWGFQSTSKDKKVAKSFWNVIMYITSKTGRDLGEADTLNEKEILLMPATQLVFEKFKNGIYYFIEI